MSPKTSAIFKILIIISMIIWGGSWVSAKAIAGRYDAYLLTFLRFFVSTIALIPIIFLMKASLVVDRRSLNYLIPGIISIGAYFFFFFKGLEKGLASVGGVFVTSLMPIFTLLISRIFFKKSFRLIDYLGILLGFSGGVIIIKLWDISYENLMMSGNMFFIICPILWAVVTISSEKTCRYMSPITFSFYSYLFCSLLFLVLSLDRNMSAIFKGDQVFWLNIFYLSVISSVLATTVYFYSTQKLNSYQTSSFAFIVPASSIILSIIFLGEKPESSTVLGGAVSVFATYLINFRD